VIDANHLPETLYLLDTLEPTARLDTTGMRLLFIAGVTAFIAKLTALAVPMEKC
jgi:hypothetical protein